MNLWLTCFPQFVPHGCSCRFPGVRKLEEREVERDKETVRQAMGQREKERENERDKERCKELELKENSRNVWQ